MDKQSEKKRALSGHQALLLLASILLVAAVAGVGFISSGRSSLLDVNQESPKQIVTKFLNAVHAGNLEKAQSFWHGPTRRISDGPTFEAYCEEMSKYSIDDIGDTFKGKSDYWFVELRGSEELKDGEASALYLQKTNNGHWSLVRGQEF